MECCPVRLPASAIRFAIHRSNAGRARVCESWGQRTVALNLFRKSRHAESSVQHREPRLLILIGISPFPYVIYELNMYAYVYCFRILGHPCSFANLLPFRLLRSGSVLRQAARVRVSPASKRGQDNRVFCRSAAIYHNYGVIMA